MGNTCASLVESVFSISDFVPTVSICGHAIKLAEILQCHPNNRFVNDRDHLRSLDILGIRIESLIEKFLVSHTWYEIMRYSPNKRMQSDQSARHARTLAADAGRYVARERSVIESGEC